MNCLKTRSVISPPPSNPLPKGSPTRNLTNYLNTALILISFILALVLPFELFVVAYVLLGPLHYLTEIGWLHRRNYFIQGKKGSQWLWLLTIAVTATWLIGGKQSSEPIAIWTFLALLSSLVFVSVQDGRLRLALIAASAVAVPPLVHNFSGITTIAFYLTTLIHVFCFTALFMLLGCLKEKSLSSFVALTALLLCAVNLLFMPQSGVDYQTTPIFLKNTIDFGSIERVLARHLGWAPSWEHSVQAMRFVAFAYTYHYLNWFSKANVTAWHKLERRGWLTIGVVYAVAVSLYVYDFKLGMQVLFLLSIGHVFLEFPLNCFSVRAICGEFGSAIRSIDFSGAPKGIKEATAES